MDYSCIREWLFSEAEKDYQKFASSLLPGVDNVLGVRLPKLRRKAKEICKISPEKFIESYECVYFEEILLKSFVIGLLRIPCNEHLRIIKDFVPLIDNWSVCDSFCASLKFIETNRYEVWKFLVPYFASENEFELRFAVVVLLNYFVTDEWINFVLDRLMTLKSDKYYAQMGIAWAISVCLMKYFDETFEKISSSRLPSVILKKSIQKGCESYRLTKEQKLKLKNLL